jgi:hypothetical protein
MGEIFLWEFWSPMRHFARKLVDLFGAMRNESTPFSTFSGWVKQLAEPEYSIDARVMEVAFPAFFGDAGVDVPARVALESDLTRHGLTVESWEQPYRCRYAGGANLARGKYFTLCSTKAETIIRRWLANYLHTLKPLKVARSMHMIWVATRIPKSKLPNCGTRGFGSRLFLRMNSSSLFGPAVMHSLR